MLTAVKVIQKHCYDMAAVLQGHIMQAHKHWVTFERQHHVYTAISEKVKELKSSNWFLLEAKFILATYLNNKVKLKFGILTQLSVCHCVCL